MGPRARGGFAVTNWRLLSEGGAWQDSADRCDRDTIPAAPFHALCAAIDADAGHSCAYDSHPDQPHCAAWAADINALCVDWFFSPGSARRSAPR